MTEKFHWTVIITPTVKKRLSKISRFERDRILQALLKLQENPFGQDIKPLNGRPEWRMRIGQWRVLLRVDKGNFTIVALTLGSRGDIYK